MWGEPPKCRKCGRIINFIRTKKGSMMPVDGFSVCVLPYMRGTLFYTETGEQIKGYLVTPGTPKAVKAYEPHWYTCPYADENRKPKPKSTAARDAIRERIEQARADEARREAAREEKAVAERKRREAEAAQLSFFGNREV